MKMMFGRLAPELFLSVEAASIQGGRVSMISDYWWRLRSVGHAQLLYACCYPYGRLSQLPVYMYTKFDANVIMCLIIMVKG